MTLFDKNRKRLAAALRENSNTPSNAVVLLQAGGEQGITIVSYERLIDLILSQPNRMISKNHIVLIQVYVKEIRQMLGQYSDKNRFFIGPLEYLNPITMVPLRWKLEEAFYSCQNCHKNMQFGWELLRVLVTSK